MRAPSSPGLAVYRDFTIDIPVLLQKPHMLANSALESWHDFCLSSIVHPLHEGRPVLFTFHVSQLVLLPR